MLNNHGLTIVGTLRHNKKEIPPSFLPNRKKLVSTSQFAFSDKMTLVSFTGKKSKAAILLSTFHSTKDIDKESKKPEIILFYNSTKGGVDTFDKMAHGYTVVRKTRRWPLRYFYGMLDQAGINSMVLYKTAKSKAIIRSTFLQNLGLQLARPHMERRLQKNLPIDVRQSIRDILSIGGSANANNIQPPPPKQSKYSRCYMCPRSKDKKCKILCCVCNKNVSNAHRLDICTNCKK